MSHKWRFRDSLPYFSTRRFTSVYICLLVTSQLNTGSRSFGSSIPIADDADDDDKKRPFCFVDAVDIESLTPCKSAQCWLTVCLLVTITDFTFWASCRKTCEHLVKPHGYRRMESAPMADSQIMYRSSVRRESTRDGFPFVSPGFVSFCGPLGLSHASSFMLKEEPRDQL